MKYITKLFFLFLILTTTKYTAYSQIDNKDNCDDKWYGNMFDFKSLSGEHKVLAGFNLGASMPIPIPNRFTKFAWEPIFSPYLGWEFSLFGEKRLGFTSGVIFTKKGMKAGADVYQMYTNVIIDDMLVEGYFTGRNETLIDNIYISLPMMLSYNGDYYKLDIGYSFNYLMMGKFNGNVKDGYIRLNSPTGPRTNIDNAPYEFNNFIKRFELALEFRFERKIKRRLYLSVGASMSRFSMMQSDFKGIEARFRNCYANVGIIYYLKKLNLK